MRVLLPVLVDGLLQDLSVSERVVPVSDGLLASLERDLAALPDLDPRGTGGSTPRSPTGSR